MKRSGFNDEQIIGILKQHQYCDVLQMEVEVWRLGVVGGSAPADAGGGECPAEKMLAEGCSTTLC